VAPLAHPLYQTGCHLNSFGALLKICGQKEQAIIEMNMEFLGYSLISFGVFMVMCEMLLSESLTTT
jgi:hypothetical protein